MARVGNDSGICIIRITNAFMRGGKMIPGKIGEKELIDLIVENDWGNSVEFALARRWGS